MPEEDAGHKRGHKHPFLACEIFKIELNAIMEKFFEEPEPKEDPQENKEDAQDLDLADTNEENDDDDVVVDSGNEPEVEDDTAAKEDPEQDSSEEEEPNFELLTEEQK